MYSASSLTELTFNFGAHAQIMKDLWAAQTGAVDPTLNNGPAHSYTPGSSAIYGNGRALWGPYGSGKVACAPLSATKTGIFDSSDSTWSELDAHGEGSAAFVDVLQVSEEWLLLVPDSSDYIGWQNLRTGEYIRGAAHGHGNTAYTGGVLCLRRGRLTAVLVPSAATSPLYVDILNRTIEHSTATSITGINFGGRLMAETGFVLMQSYYLNVETDTATYAGSTQPQGYRPILLPSRRLITPPFAASRWFTKDFAFNTTKQSDIWETGNKVRGGAFAPNGDIIGAPYDTDLIPYYNYAANTVTSGPVITGSTMFSGAVLMPNLRILLIPRTVDKFYIYDHLDTTVAVSNSNIAICGPYFS